jgi:ATP-dependent DNA ligase
MWWWQVILMAFDLIFLNGQPLLRKNLLQRRYAQAK